MVATSDFLGGVTLVRPEDDGDFHVVLEDGGFHTIAEARMSSCTVGVKPALDMR
jgi:hypothetical protein